MTKTLRGINLGGWLVAERWMTPELFEGIKGKGEVEIVKQLGKREAEKRLRYHRNTFITEADFSWIAQHSFDVVRLPVGYWIFKETNDYVAGEEYVKRAFLWAKKYKLKIILDLHGLQGSQNGKAHSGQEGRVAFYRLKNIFGALETVRHIAKTYGQAPHLSGIQIINEPHWPFLGLGLWYYCHRALKDITKYTRPEVKVIISDGYKPRRALCLIKLLHLKKRLVLDIHLYQVFSPADHKKNAMQYKMTVSEKWHSLIEQANRHVPVMIGEWSVAVAHSPGGDAFSRDYFLAQRQVFDQITWAYCYWSYKAPGRGGWDYRTVATRLDSTILK